MGIAEISAQHLIWISRGSQPTPQHLPDLLDLLRLLAIKRIHKRTHMQQGMRGCQLSNCCKMHAFLRMLSASTHAHARHANSFILNQDHFIKWGHSNAWNDCMLRWRSYSIPCSWLNALQDHVLTRLLDTDLSLQMLHLLHVIHLLNLHRDALGLSLLLILLACLLITFLLYWRSWLRGRRISRGRSRLRSWRS